ncbi:MAG: ABC transporter ATP-binding protein [Candidatus Marsarchaeota archaeon]|nr:ABC transporter ATP-binding protein [Candidatus Marsarchaeota archaeon]MCL5102257.1 ABC transporter ATP-binding protein [Candidatus Marsarchaeota archaeon]
MVQKNSETVISFDNVQKVYSNKSGMTYVALRGISFEIKRGEFVAIMGPSGSGKTTVLDLIGTLDSPTAGTITISGKRVTEMSNSELATLRNEEIGFVFQSYNLVPYLSAIQNVTLPTLVSKRRGEEVMRTAAKLLEEVGLAGKFEKKPNELSGGEQQRVAVVRALINNPKILLADEPTGNLDTKSAIAVLQILARVNREYGTTIVLSTHDPEVGIFAKRRIFIRDGIITKENMMQKLSETKKL